MRIVLDIISVIALIAAIAYFGTSIKDMPAVYWSVANDACSRIEVANSVVSCSKLPSYDRYELIYVE